MANPLIDRQVPTCLDAASSSTHWTLRSLASLRMTLLQRGGSGRSGGDGWAESRALTVRQEREGCGTRGRESQKPHAQVRRMGHPVERDVRRKKSKTPRANTARGAPGGGRLTGPLRISSTFCSGDHGGSSSSWLGAMVLGGRAGLRLRLRGCRFWLCRGG
jgi:hypothetical protein